MFSLCYSKTGLAEAPYSGASSTSRERRRPRTAPAPPADPQPVHAPSLLHPPPVFVRRRKPAASSLMHPFQWCNGESPGREGAAPAGDQAGGARPPIPQPPPPSQPSFSRDGMGGKASRAPHSVLHSAEFEKTNTKESYRGLTRGPGRVSEPVGRAGNAGAEGSTAFVWRLRSSTRFPGLCALQLCPLLWLSAEN